MVEFPGTRGAGEEEIGSCYLMGTKFLFEAIKWVLVIVTHNPVKNTSFSFFFTVHGGLPLISPAFPFPIAEISMSTF